MNFLFSTILDIGPDHVQFTFSFLLCAKILSFWKPIAHDPAPSLCFDLFLKN